MLSSFYLKKKSKLCWACSAPNQWRFLRDPLYHDRKKDGAFSLCLLHMVSAIHLAKACAWWAITSAFTACVGPPRSTGRTMWKMSEDTVNPLCLFCAGGILLILSSWSEKKESIHTSFWHIPDGLQERPLILTKTLWQRSSCYPPRGREGKGKVWMGGFLKMTQVVGSSAAP